MGLDFPKKMRWGDWDIAYPRPLRWLLALHGDRVIPFGIADVAAGNRSSGHPQLSVGMFDVEHACDYVAALKKHKVMVDVEERRNSILEQLTEIEKSESVKVVERDRVIPQVLHLVEWPMLTVATFDGGFLRAPKEVLVSEMVEHQKYFPVEGMDGTLKNRFVITANNTPSEDIRHGNVKVVSARLADGVFLYEQDLKKPLEEFNELLKHITFQKELGSVYDKVQRLVDNVEVLHGHLAIADLEIAKRAALLSKADLASDLVGEFPDLQGVVGRLYALAHDESQEVADAIDEHWMPRGEKAPLPQVPAGVLVSLAEKFDNLISCFSLGFKPTSSSDPYALRRQVLGIIKILIAGEHRLAILDVLDQCYDRFASKVGYQLACDKATTLKDVKAFFTNRIKTVFQDYGLRKDEIEASLSTGFSDIYDSFCRAKALHHFRVDNPNFSLLYEVFKRARGQIEGQGKPAFDEALLQEDAEKALFDKLRDVESRVEGGIREGNYDAAYDCLAELQPVLADVFDHVRILADDEALKNNRIALLQRVFALFDLLLDFGKIQEGKKVIA
ncbi:Glycine--tRNA ligase beta subunit [Chlamydiales bacterium SCGC AG-110-M15]|nr:Glycine--tRNA ligase beta subunit [Chlamydiales bacterium SCGC AG-110-M15]